MKTALKAVAVVLAVLLIVLFIYRVEFRPQPSSVQPSRGLSAAPGLVTNGAEEILPVPSPSQPRTMSPQEEMVGIGVALNFDQRLGAPRIANVLLNSPASQAGLTPGLIIQKLDEVPTQGMRLQQCVERLRGTVGTKVALELVDPEQALTNRVELTRQRVKIGPGNWVR